jgi:hypothetical protein
LVALFAYNHNRAYVADVLHSAQLYAAALDANLASPGARPCGVDGLGAAIDTDHAARRPGDLSQLREGSDRTAPDVDLGVLRRRGRLGYTSPARRRRSVGRPLISRVCSASLAYRTHARAS